MDKDIDVDVKLTYSKYRMEKAAEDLIAAKLLYKEGHFRVANNRAYYSVFHAIRAVLALEGFDSESSEKIILKPVN